MSHVEHDHLWTHAHDGAPLGEAAQAHLTGCAECTTMLEDIRLAQAALSALPAVPDLPPALARRVGEALAEEADRRAARSFTAWWRRLLEPRFAVPALAAVALVVWALSAWLAPRPAPAPIAVSPVVAPVAPLDPVPGPPVLPPPPTPAPQPVRHPLTASVASASRASVGDQHATRAQSLSEGSVVATAPGGSLWLRLPDGTRAGMTGASQVTLATLEQDTLALELTHGSLAMVVPHRADRLLTVHAGELVVKDLGTRFLVSTDSPGRVLVAVEEGQVEVTTPVGSQTLKAGHAVRWANGKVETLTWESTPVAPGVPTPASRLHDDEGDDTEVLPEAQPVTPAVTPTTSPATPAPHTASGEDEWAALPLAGQPPPAGTVEPVKPAPLPAPASHVTETGFSLRLLEKKLLEVQKGLPFVGEAAIREGQVRTITRLADAGDCGAALSAADQWLAAARTDNRNELRWRRAVLMQKMRCLNRLGRVTEAAAVKAELEVGP
jgi:hypothetical protein